MQTAGGVPMSTTDASTATVDDDDVGSTEGVELTDEEVSGIVDDEAVEDGGVDGGVETVGADVLEAGMVLDGNEVVVVVGCTVVVDVVDGAAVDEVVLVVVGHGAFVVVVEQCSGCFLQLAGCSALADRGAAQQASATAAAAAATWRRLTTRSVPAASRG